MPNGNGFYFKKHLLRQELKITLSRIVYYFHQFFSAIPQIKLKNREVNSRFFSHLSTPDHF